MLETVLMALQLVSNQPTLPSLEQYITNNKSQHVYAQSSPDSPYQKNLTVRVGNAPLDEASIKHYGSIYQKLFFSGVNKP